METDTALAVLPAGTTNVWAIEQGQKPFSWWKWWALRDNARLLAEVPAQHVDIGVCNERPFLLWSGIGLDAQTIHRLEPRPRLAKYLSVPHYFATTVWEATFWHGMDLRVWADDKEVEGHYLLAVATNIRHYAGGMALISPEAFLDDGVMDLWLFTGNNLADALRHFFGMVAGRHLTSEQARCLRFHSARVESDSAFSIQVDGEPMLGGQHAQIKIKHRALKVLMPRNALHLLKTPNTG
jgi:diacylglycerol kinase (ATP)